MRSFSRLAIAAALVTGFAGFTQAQSYRPQTSSGWDRYEALYIGQDRLGEALVRHVGAAVPPSMSHTVMGLRVPR